MQFEYKNELQNKVLEHDKKIEYFNKLGMLFIWCFSEAEVEQDN